MAGEGDGTRTMLMERVIALMADGQERASLDIAEALCVAVSAVKSAVTALSRENDAQEIHVARIDKERRIYVRGAGKNCRTNRANSRTELERSWPRADPVTQRAMHAMVSVGHRVNGAAGVVDACVEPPVLQTNLRLRIPREQVHGNAPH